MLIWLKAGAWREGVSELFKAIRMELQSLQPQDSSTIKWSKTPSGMTAHVVDPPVVAGGAKRIAPTEDAVGTPAGAGIGELGQLKTITPVGAGYATYQKVSIGEDGTVTPVGEVLPCVIPKLYHYTKGE